MLLEVELVDLVVILMLLLLEETHLVETLLMLNNGVAFQIQLRY